MRNFFLTLLCLVVASCDKPFSYHPYDARFSGEQDINAKNIAEIERRTSGKDTLRVAFVSDTHGYYTEAKEMIADLNSRADSIDFVVHLGDLTDCGTTREYEWIRDIMQQLRIPYVAMIGNHDFLGTGDEVFLKMFGSVDVSFIAGRVKLLCLNTNATEYDYIAAVPNFDFMENERSADSARFDRTIICMHSRPYSDQFNNNVVKAFEYYVNLFPGLMFCVNGHDHYICADDLYGDGVVYYGIDSASHRNYTLFTIRPDGYDYENIAF